VVDGSIRIKYRDSPAVQEGEPRLRHGPKAGDRLPDAHIVEHGRERWLQDVLAAPTYHLLLCGRADDWNNDQLAHLSERYADLVTVHRLARQATADVAADILHDARGEALARLGVEHAARYIVRPDGHIGYRDGATDLSGVERYVARWLSGRGARETP
jgi:Aromatic-ring hydroxylase, C-terminal